MSMNQTRQSGRLRRASGEGRRGSLQSMEWPETREEGEAMTVIIQIPSPVCRVTKRSPPRAVKTGAASSLPQAKEVIAFMDIIIRLRDAAQNESRVPQAVRLKRLLKLALRSFGFRCVSVETGEEPEKHQPAHGGNDERQG